MSKLRHFLDKMDDTLRRVVGGADRTDVITSEIVALLRQYPPEQFTIHTQDSAHKEARRLREKLTLLLQQAGWELKGASDAVGNDYKHGILILTKKRTPAQQALCDYLMRQGCRTKLVTDRVKGPMQITIGSR
jgi:hypothetical protein